MLHRRNFLKQGSLAGLATLVIPGMASAAFLKGGTKAKHIIFILLRGVAKEESSMDTGYRCMPFLFGEPAVKSNINNKYSKGSTISNKLIFENFFHAGSDISHNNALASIASGSYDTNPIPSKFLDHAFIDSQLDNVASIKHAEKIFKKERSAVTTLVLADTDVAHYNYTEYCSNLYQTDQAIMQLWESTQRLHTANETLLVVASDHGRNDFRNDIIDENGFGGRDHSSESARQGFCVMIGSEDIIGKGRIISDRIENINLLPALQKLQNPVESFV